MFSIERAKERILLPLKKHIYTHTPTYLPSVLQVCPSGSSRKPGWHWQRKEPRVSRQMCEHADGLLSRHSSTSLQLSPSACSLKPTLHMHLCTKHMDTSLQFKGKHCPFLTHGPGVAAKANQWGQVKLKPSLAPLVSFSCWFIFQIYLILFPTDRTW